MMTLGGIHDVMCGGESWTGEDHGKSHARKKHDQQNTYGTAGSR